jgi:hypothetical protein
MMQTIEIYQETGKRKKTTYRAIRGQQQAEGKTAGQALDSLEKMLSATGEPANSLVVVQRFQPDAFFPETQQQRLQALMAQFQATIAHDNTLSPNERNELEQLVEAEWVAAIARAANIMAQTQTSQPR